MALGNLFKTPAVGAFAADGALPPPPPPVAGLAGAAPGFGAAAPAAGLGVTPLVVPALSAAFRIAALPFASPGLIVVGLPSAPASTLLPAFDVTTSPGLTTLGVGVFGAAGALGVLVP